MALTLPTTGLRKKLTPLGEIMDTAGQEAKKASQSFKGLERKPYDYMTAPSPFTKENAPTTTGALSGEGTGSEMKAPIPVVQAPPQTASMAGHKNVQTEKPDTSMIPVANAGESRPMNLFSNEEEAYSKMKADNVPDEQAYQMIKDHRKSIMGDNTSLSPIESAALLKMQQDGVSSEDAVKMLQENRQANPTEPKKQDTRPLWKQAGEGAVNLMAGNLETVLKYGGNLLDLGTGGQLGFGEDVKGMTEQNKNLFGDSTAFKVGTYAPDVALGVSPLGGGYLAGAKGLGSLAGRSSIVGGAFGASTPILEKGSDATMGEVATGLGIGATAGAVLPVVGAGLVKGIKSVKPYITKTLPQNLQVSGQFNRADLTNVSERISKLTGKDIEVDDASRWLLDREIKGDLATQRKQVQSVVQNSMDDADKLLASKTGDIGSTKEAQALRKALKEKLDNYGSYTKEGKFIPSAGNEAQANKMMSLIDNPSMTLKEMNDGRRILADGLFNKQGTMKELASKEGWQNVWKDTSAFIEKNAPGFRAINKNTEVGIAIDKAMIKKETAEQTKAMLSYLGLGGGTGGAIGYGTSGGDISTTIKGIGIGFGVGQLSRVLNSPSVKSNLAYYLNKLSSSSRKSIQDLQKGIEIKPENIGKIVEEMKLLPPPSGLKPSAGISNVKPIISPKAGLLEKTSTAISGKTGIRPSTSYKEGAIPQGPQTNKPKLLNPPKNANPIINTNSTTNVRSNIKSNTKGNTVGLKSSIIDNSTGRIIPSSSKSPTRNTKPTIIDRNSVGDKKAKAGLIKKPAHIKGLQMKQSDKVLIEKLSDSQKKSFNSGTPKEQERALEHLRLKAKLESAPIKGVTEKVNPKNKGKSTNDMGVYVDEDGYLRNVGYEKPSVIDLSKNKKGLKPKK